MTSAEPERIIHLNPLEIVKRTPKSNCGACGYPTCLAFGAAVSASGISPALCPHIDLTGLDIDNIKTKESAEEQDLKLIEHLKEKINSHDFSAIAEPLGAYFNHEQPETIQFTYLNQPVILAKNCDILLGQAIPEDPRDQILIYNYVHSKGGRSPDGTWIGMESLPNSISKIKTLDIYCEERLARLFEKINIIDAQKLCTQIGGFEPEEKDTASFSMIIQVLPKVPQKLLFWQAEPEDGFTAKVKILFDHHVMDFLDLESLVFSSERMADRLLFLAGERTS